MDIFKFTLSLWGHGVTARKCWVAGEAPALRSVGDMLPDFVFAPISGSLAYIGRLTATFSCSWGNQ